MAGTESLQTEGGMEEMRGKDVKIGLWPLVFLIVFVVAGLAVFFGRNWDWAQALMLIGIGLLPLVIAVK